MGVKGLNWLLLPPLAFGAMLLLALGVSGLGSLLAATGKASRGKDRAYACGQEVDQNRIQPNYNEFFPIAFFFTILHVAALMIATTPKGEWLSSVLYICVALLALRVLFRRDENVGS
jgi:NADH:ubiquinone oxidoreductase subunit 3 (subunit A)